MDDDGLVPDALREALDGRRARGAAVKFLYTIPNFHNPAGVTLAVERRRRGAGDLPRVRRRSSSRTTRTGCSASTGQTYPALRSIDPTT